MWKEIGGDKIGADKIVEKKTVHVETSKQANTQKQRQMELA